VFLLCKGEVAKVEARLIPPFIALNFKLTNEKIRAYF